MEDLKIFVLLLLLSGAFLLVVFFLSIAGECIASKTRLWFDKWIKGECRHICKLCKYHNQCLLEIYKK